MAANVSESPGQPPGVDPKEKPSEHKLTQDQMETAKEISKASSSEGKEPGAISKRKNVSNESEDEDKLESLDDICRKKFKPIAPKPFLKKDHHQSVVMTAMPVKEGSDVDKTMSSVESDSPSKGAVIFMGPNMQLYPSAPFIVQPPPLVPCSGTVVPGGGAFSFAMPTPVGHFVPQLAHMPGFCPSGQFQTCCVRFPPPVIEGRDYFVNGVRPLGHKTNKDDSTKMSETAKPFAKGRLQSSLTTKDSVKSKASRYKYSILYNGPIYKGSSSIPQTNITSTPQVENFVPTTESDNAGNIKLSLPAVLTSTGVLQITVPSLGAIEPKRTTNPSAFPQIKLQTVHGAVLTPGVLPTVLSPQHHPNSGHVVVVSAHNQTSASHQVSSIRTSHSVSSAISARSHLAIPKSTVLSTNSVNSISSLPNTVVSSSVSSSNPANISAQTSTTSPSSIPGIDSHPSTVSVTEGVGSPDQSLRSILTRVSMTDSSLTPATTVNMASVRHTTRTSSETSLSSGTSHLSFGTTALISERNASSETGNANSAGGTAISETAMPTCPPVLSSPFDRADPSVGPNSREGTGSRTGNLHLASFHINPNSASSAPVRKDHTSTTTSGGHQSSVNSAANMSALHRSGENNNRRSDQNMAFSSNPKSDIDMRWQNNSAHDVNHSRSLPGITGAKNINSNLRLQRSNPVEITNTLPIVTASSHSSSTSYTVSPSVSTSSNRAVPPMSESQHSIMPRMSSTTQGLGSVGSTAGGTHPQAAVPSGQNSRNTTAMNVHDSSPVSTQETSQSHVPNMSGSIQRPGLNHIQHQRLSDTSTGIASQNQQSNMASLPISRTMRGTDHPAGIQQLSHTNRNDTPLNSSRSNLNSNNIRNDSTSNDRNNLNSSTLRTDSTPNGNRNDLNGPSVGAKRQAHQQQYPHTPAGMPQLHQQSTSSVAPSDSRHRFPLQTPTTRSSIATANNIQQSYTSSMESQQDSSAAPPVVCVTPQNEFVRPSSSGHRWPQTPANPRSTTHGQIRPTTSISPARSSQTASQRSFTSTMGQIHPTTSISSSGGSQTASQRSFSTSMQPSQRDPHTRIFPPIQQGPSESTQIEQMHTPSERSVTSMGHGYSIDDISRNPSQGSRFNSSQGAKSTSRPWQSTNESSTSSMSNAYGGLGLRGRSVSTSQLNESGSFMARSVNQPTERFRTPTSVSPITDQNDGSPQIQSVPLHSNVSANSRQAMTDVINRRTSRTSRPQQRQSSEHLQTQSNTGSNQAGSHGEASLSTEQDDADNGSRYASSVVAPERCQSSTVGHPHQASNHIVHGSSMLHSDSVPRLPVPIVHPMLYGNSPSVPNLAGMGSLHGVSLTGGLGGHSMPRHNIPQHPMTPPPVSVHHTPPRPGPHSHNHMFVPPPYASMHRPLYMHAPSPRPPDIGLMSPRTYSHVHDSGLYSPRFQSMQNLPSSSSLADNILSSHLARTFSDDRLDTCCSGLHAHSPPAHNNTRHILPPGFSSPAVSLGHPLSLPTSTAQPERQSSSFPGRPHSAMPSDIFGPSHLEGIGLPVLSQTSATATSITPSCVQSTPSVPAPLTVLTNLNTISNSIPSTSTTSSNLHSDGTSASTPSSHNSPPTSAPSPSTSNQGTTSLHTRVFIGNTSDKYLPLESSPTPPTSCSTGGSSSTAAPLNNDQVVKFGDVVLECSRQILRESGRTVLCCWHCDYHTAEPKKMYRHQKKDTKVMKCQLCDYKGYSRCNVNQHFKEQHMDKM